MRERLRQLAQGIRNRIRGGGGAPAAGAAGANRGSAGGRGG